MRKRKRLYQHKANSRHGPFRGSKAGARAVLSRMSVRCSWGWVDLGG